MRETITCIDDLKRLAQRRVPRMFYDYADSGAWTESTYRANESDFHAIKLRQRVAVDMRNRTLETEMIGRRSRCRWPCPDGLTGMQHAMARSSPRAAAKFGVPFTLSTMSICSIEDVAANSPAPFWFQLYVMRDRDFCRPADRSRQGGGLLRPGADADCRFSGSATRMCATAFRRRRG